MSLRVSVLINIGLVCHSEHQYLPLHALFAMPLSAWYVYQRISTEIFYSGMPPRVFHGRRTVLNIVVVVVVVVCVCVGGLVNLGSLRAMRGCHHVFQNYWGEGCLTLLPLFLCLCFLICQPCMWHRVSLVASTILVCQYLWGPKACSQTLLLQFDHDDVSYIV